MSFPAVLALGNESVGAKDGGLKNESNRKQPRQSTRRERVNGKGSRYGPTGVLDWAALVIYWCTVSATGRTTGSRARAF